jgi:hypothetical protein
MDGDVTALFDLDLLNVEWSFLVVVEVAQEIGIDVLGREGRDKEKEKDGDCYTAHEDLR